MHSPSSSCLEKEYPSSTSAMRSGDQQFMSIGNRSDGVDAGAKTSNNRTESEELLLDEAKRRFERGRLITQSNKPEESIIEYKAALTIQESIFGRYHRDTAIIYFWLGWAHYFQKVPDTNKALSAYCTCLKIGRYLSGDGNTPNINDTFIAGLLKEQGFSESQVKEYDHYINKSIEHEKRGDNHRKTGDSIISAMDAYEDAIAVEEDVFGMEDNPALVFLWRKMACLCSNRRKYVACIDWTRADRINDAFWLVTEENHRKDSEEDQKGHFYPQVCEHIRRGDTFVTKEAYKHAIVEYAAAANLGKQLASEGEREEFLQGVGKLGTLLENHSSAINALSENVNKTVVPNVIETDRNADDDDKKRSDEPDVEEKFRDENDGNKYDSRNKNNNENNNDMNNENKNPEIKNDSKEIVSLQDISDRVYQLSNSLKDHTSLLQGLSITKSTADENQDGSILNHNYLLMTERMEEMNLVVNKRAAILQNLEKTSNQNSMPDKVQREMLSLFTKMGDKLTSKTKKDCPESPGSNSKSPNNDTQTQVSSRIQDIHHVLETHTKVLSDLSVTVNKISKPLKNSRDAHHDAKLDGRNEARHENSRLSVVGANQSSMCSRDASRRKVRSTPNVVVTDHKESSETVAVEDTNDQQNSRRIAKTDRGNNNVQSEQRDSDTVNLINETTKLAKKEDTTLSAVSSFTKSSKKKSPPPSTIPPQDQTTLNARTPITAGAAHVELLNLMRSQHGYDEILRDLEEPILRRQAFLDTQTLARRDAWINRWWLRFQKVIIIFSILYFFAIQLSRDSDSSSKATTTTSMAASITRTSSLFCSFGYTAHYVMQTLAKIVSPSTVLPAYYDGDDSMRKRNKQGDYMTLRTSNTGTLLPLYE